VICWKYNSRSTTHNATVICQQLCNRCHPMAGWLMTMTSDVSTGRPGVIAMPAAVHNTFTVYITFLYDSSHISCQRTVKQTLLLLSTISRYILQLQTVRKGTAIFVCRPFPRLLSRLATTSTSPPLIFVSMFTLTINYLQVKRAHYRSAHSGSIWLTKT